MAQRKNRKRANGTHKLIVAVKQHPYLTVLIVGLVVAVTAGSVYAWMYPQTIDSLVDSANDEFGILMVTGEQVWSGMNPAPNKEDDYAVQQSGFTQSKFELATITWRVMGWMNAVVQASANGATLPMQSYTVSSPGQIITLSDTTAVLMIQNTSALISYVYNSQNNDDTFFPQGWARRVALVADGNATDVADGLKSAYQVDMNDADTAEFSNRLPFPLNFGGLFPSKVLIDTCDDGTCVQMTHALGQLVMGAAPDHPMQVNSTPVAMTRIQ